MTANQIRKALEVAGIDMSTILQIAKDTFEVYVADGDSGHADYDKTEAALEATHNVLPWGGFKTGYGSWILSLGHKVSEYAGEGFADPMHY